MDIPSFPDDRELDIIQQKYPSNPQKPQMIINKGPIGDGQVPIEDGLLEPLDYEYPDVPMLPEVWNDNNGIPQNNKWAGPLEPIELDPKLEAKRKQNKKDAAKCLQKKKDQHSKNKKKAEDLKTAVESRKSANQFWENQLSFAVENVFIPCLGNNNLNPDEVYGFQQNLESQKDFIAQEIQKEMEIDGKLAEVAEKLQVVNEELAIAQYNKDNKKVMAVQLKLDERTFESRLTRKKQKQETIFYEHKAILFEYEIKHQDRLSIFLNRYWNHFYPTLWNILSNHPPPIVLDHAQRTGTTEQLFQLRELLFNPG
uniref:BZIP domain-containing protein n=1 Tax=Caenorhabditis tropicalis TaxID=1561998 RepID=A0A1I7U8S6_9PELO